MRTPPRKGRKKKPAPARITLLRGEDALATVTWLYHNRKLTQQQIAKELGVSPPTVMRLLRQAEESGLVTVSLRLDILQRVETSRKIADHFGLREVFVVPTAKTDTPVEVIQAVGRTGALYLQAKLQPDEILAVAWGKTLLEVARALPDHPVSGLVIAQSMGGLNSGASAIPSRVISLVAERLHARIYHLYVPAIVSTKNLRDILVADPGIKGALEIARQATYFIAGIGKVGADATVVEAGFLDMATIDRLRIRGAVGDIATRYFDINGNPVRDELEDRIVGLSREDMKQIKTVIGIACGVDKTNAILGALRSKLLHVLILDDQTAFRILKSVETDQENNR
jgi:DNA-binding transcriptional regulator LsrR (DeoR family)